MSELIRRLKETLLKKTNCYFQMDKFAFLRDEVLVDRATQNSARARFDNLTKEASELDLQTRQLTESLDKLVRIQAR